MAWKLRKDMIYREEGKILGRRVSTIAGHIREVSTRNQDAGDVSEQDGDRRLQ